MVITRIRWEENNEWYGLKAPYSPRQVKELIPFENNVV